MRLPCRILLASLAVLAASVLAAPRATFSQNTSPTSAQAPAQTSAQTSGQASLRASAQASVRQAPDLAAPWGDAVRAFAGKVAAGIGAERAISLDVVNISRLSGVDAGNIERRLQAALGSAGFPSTAEPPADVRVHVTLSESADGCLWVAEIHSQSGDRVAMMDVRAPDRAAPQAAPIVPVLRRTPLLSRAEPILDFAMAMAPAAGNDGSPLLFVLGPEQVSVFSQREGNWVKMDAASIAPYPWPRDLRGEIVATNTVSSADGLKIYLPGVFCTGSMQTRLELKCSPSAGLAWPLGGNTGAAIAPGRNYFNISVDGVESAWPKSYSIASNSDEEHPARILTAENGSAELFGNSPQNPEATFWRGGDEFASIEGCDDSWNVVVTGAGDWTKRDYLQDYEIVDREATMAGQPLEFSGPIVALWPSEGGKSARAVSRDLQTGMYEASLINLYCGH